MLQLNKKIKAKPTKSKSNNKTAQPSPLKPFHSSLQIFFYIITGSTEAAESLLNWLEKKCQSDPDFSQDSVKKLESEKLLRSFIFREAYKVALDKNPKNSKTLSASEQLMLDASLSTQIRLGQIESYLARLSIQERITVVLSDNLKFEPYEISTILQKSIDAINLIHSQAYLKLERWIWGQTA